MKLAIFSDLHLGVRQDSAEWHTIALEWADWFVEELQKRGVKRIFFLGDFFHNKFVISSTTLYTASLFLEKLKDFEIDLIFGNHDLYYLNNPEVASVNVFSGYSNIHVHSKPYTEEIGGRKIVMVGWGYNPLEYSGDVLMTHAEIDVFKFNEFLTCTSDLKPSALLKHYKHVISGHFHGKQVKQYDTGRIEYIGNPFSMDYSDSSLEKVFGILDTDTMEMEYVTNPISPRFLKYNLSDLVKIRDLDSFISDIQNTFVRITIDKDITLADANELKRVLSLCNPRDIKFEWTNKEQFLVDDKAVQGFSLTDVINEYIDSIDVESKEAIKDYILNLYKKYGND